MRKSNLGGVMPDQGKRPSEVFGARLREMRESRGKTQQWLAERLTEVGVAINQAGVLRVEKGERGISLDEAIAFAAALNVVFASLLSPPDDELVRVSDHMALNGEAMR